MQETVAHVWSARTSGPAYKVFMGCGYQGEPVPWQEYKGRKGFRHQLIGGHEMWNV